MRPKKLFGQVAIRRGHINPAQLEKALEIQKQMVKHGERKLLGLIMLERGMIDNEQLIDILRCMEAARAHSLDITSDKLYRMPV